MTQCDEHRGRAENRKCLRSARVERGRGRVTPD